MRKPFQNIFIFMSGKINMVLSYKIAPPTLGKLLYNENDTAASEH